jgi:DNA-binding CsgD family transcriptional regulator
VAETVTDADLRGLLDVLDAARTIDCTEGLPVAVLERLSDVVACDSLSFLDLEAATQRLVLEQSVHEPDVSDDVDPDAFWRHYWDCLPCSYPDRSHDLRSVTTVSDFYSQREFHSTGMYVEYLGEFMEHEAMLCLPAPDGRSRRVLLFRSEGPDFDGRDRLLLALLRPHLVEIYRELERRRSPAAQLTARQRELMLLVSCGYSNDQIARALTISPGTVRKHLENIFEGLDAPSRAAAAVLVASAPAD